MIEHTFFAAITRHYPGHYGSMTTVIEESYCTNNDGSGVFTSSCLTQLTGNCQFSGGKTKLKNWLNEIHKGGLPEKKFFISSSAAAAYAKKRNEMDPLEKIPIRVWEPGELVNTIAGRARVVSQFGYDVVVTYLDEFEDQYTTTYQSYELGGAA